MARRLVALPLVVLAACDAPGPAPSVPPAPIEASAALPRCASRADVERLHGQKVRVEAVYDVEPTPVSKGLEAAYLQLDDGTELVRSYRPVSAELGLVEKRVVAVGTVCRDACQAEHVQQLMAPHFYPDHIEIATGEASITPAPAERPAPRSVVRAGDLAGRKRRWVQAAGTLESLRPTGDDQRSDARLVLADGAVIVLPNVVHRTWQELVGAAITVVGKVVATGEQPGEVPAINARVHCAGHVERCTR